MIPTSQHPDPATRKALDDHFSRWAKRAESTSRGDFWALQAAAVKSQRIDGEAFLLWRGDKLLHLPPEQLADLTTDTMAAGVELSDDGAAIAYHVHPIRPDALQATYAPPVRIDAADILHIFEPARPGAVRSVSPLAAILLALSELDSAEDALLTQTKIAALLSVILTNEGEMTGDDSLQDGQSLEPRAILRMAGNWKVHAVAPQQSQQAGDFLRHLTHRNASGVGVPVWLVTSDVSQANYSSLRAALVAFRQRIERYQFQTLVPQFLDPVWQRVATMAALELGIEITEDLYSVEWITASARRWRVAHSPTTRRLPWKPSAHSLRQSSAPFRQPSCQCLSRAGNQGVRLFCRRRKTSSRSPRSTRRTSLRLSPVMRTIRLMGTPSRPILKPLILPPLCSGQDARGEFGMTGHLADLRHRAADCRQERIACVVEKVPAVGDLYGVRKSL